MKITLFDDEVMLPDSRGDHMLVQTGIDESNSQDGPVISTDVHCVYSVGAKVIDFRKNTESVNLRFEDALLWAVRYARTRNRSRLRSRLELWALETVRSPRRPPSGAAR